MPNPNDYQKQDEWMGVCVPKMMQDKSMANDQAVAACMNMWEKRGNKDSQSQEKNQSMFSFTELSSADSTPKFMDGLAADDEHPFTAMSGEDVFIKSADLEAYIQNTQAIIDGTKTEGGEIVGLPIDPEGHNHKGGAGWIVGLQLDKTRNVIRFLVNWTDKGIAAIKGNLSRFFSPSVDTEKKVIYGGSLTNWPATRNEKGQILLRPIELSQEIKEIDMAKTIDEVMVELESLKTANADLSAKFAALSTPPAPPASPEDITPEMKEFISNVDGAEELGKAAQEIAMRRIEDEKRKMHVKDFCAQFVGGTKERPIGLKVRASELAAALLSLPDKQRVFIEKVLTATSDSLIDFAEHGFAGNDYAQGKPLPAEYRESLKLWVDSGKAAPAWFEQVGRDLGLGDSKDYNLSEFAKKEE